MMDFLKTLYGVIGAPHPMLTLMIATLIGAFLFGGGWWLIGKQYDKESIKLSSEKTTSQNSPTQQKTNVPSTLSEGKQTSAPAADGVAPTPREEADSKSSSPSNKRQRPVAIKIKGGKNITIKNNVGIGDMDLIDAENVENLDADKNILITPNDTRKK